MSDRVVGPVAGQLPLRIGIAGYCVGTGLSALTYQPRAFSFLFQGLDWSSAATQQFVDLAAYTLLVVAGLIFFRRASWLGLIATAWVFMEIGTAWYSKPRFYELSPFTASLRYVAPIALLLLIYQRHQTAAWFLRIAAAATFAGHGIEAVQQHGIFLDYIITAFLRIGVDLPEETAAILLLVIGIADFLVAAAVLFRPARWVLLYMAAWGLITAFSRVVHSGAYGINDFLERLVHCTAPLALLLIPRPQDQETKPANFGRD